MSAPHKIVGGDPLPPATGDGPGTPTPPGPAPELATKRCKTCGEVKPLSNFHTGRGTHGRVAHCKPCNLALVKRRAAKRRAEMGDEAWLERSRRITAASRRRTGNVTGRAYGRARRQALQALADNHRREFEHLFLLARRGELDRS